MARDRIVLRGLRVHAFHGLFPAEAADGQEFVIDLELEVDLGPAAISDDIADTVDYAQLAERVAQRVAEERWDLIERVAGRVCELALEHPLVLSASATIHKPDAPMPFQFEDVAVTVHRSAMKLAVALGGNLGDAAGILTSAIGDLGIVGDVTAVSSLYRSAPVGGPEQPPFLNAVVVIETSIPLEQVLKQLQGIEARYGRVRTERWGPRTLDLDIVASDGGEFRTPELEVPHPRAAERRFVLEPLAEIWPGALVGGSTAREALEAVLEQDVTRLDGDHWRSDSGRGAGWVAAQAVIFGAALAAAIIDAGSAGGAGWMPWVGRAAIAGGAVEMVLGLRALGRNLTAFPEPLETATLISTGIYRRVRHPIYGANVLLLTGLGLHQRSVSGLVVGGIAAAFFWAKAGHEEARLVRRYPEYEKYRTVARRRLIPWIL